MCSCNEVEDERLRISRITSKASKGGLRNVLQVILGKALFKATYSCRRVVDVGSVHLFACLLLETTSPSYVLAFIILLSRFACDMRSIQPLLHFPAGGHEL